MNYLLALGLLLAQALSIQVGENWVDYSQGGDNWEGICATGKLQSPINIDLDSVNSINRYEVDASFPALESGQLIHDDSSLRVPYDKGKIGFLLNDHMSNWTTRKFTFHAPAEHTIEGKSYDAELHFVASKNDNPNESLILAIMFELDETAEDNIFLENLKLSELSEDSNIKDISNIGIVKFFEPLLESHVYNYQGSMPIPP
jgi:carbonic anhydrase